MKYTINDIASTIVVINGLAITAGSNPNFLANIGREQPTILAIDTVNTNVKHTTNATLVVTLSININLTKLAAAKVIPIINETLNSFHITFNKSVNSISLRDKLRIIVTLACPQALPPVSISIGINDVNITIDANAVS